MAKLIAIIVVIIISILLIGSYLGPDDLAGCDSVPSDKGKCKKADVIVAVSGGDTNARAKEAIDLYKSGWAPYLIFSGAAADTSGPSNAEAMKKYALSHGVPSNAIITEGMSKNTHENAALSENVFTKHNFHRVILVTSGYHQRRASIEFHKSTGDSVIIVNHPVKRDKQWSHWWWATPKGWWLAGSELVKILLVYTGIAK